MDQRKEVQTSSYSFESNAPARSGKWASRCGHARFTQFEIYVATSCRATSAHILEAIVRICRAFAQVLRSVPCRIQGYRCFSTTCGRRETVSPSDTSSVERRLTTVFGGTKSFPAKRPIRPVLAGCSVPPNTLSSVNTRNRTVDTTGTIAQVKAATWFVW